MNVLNESILDAQVPAQAQERPEGFRRVQGALSERRHAREARWLEVAARTSQEAADALGVSLGQIAKSVVFRRRADEAAVMVITSGDKRVDEKKLAQHTGPLGRADADYVKTRTGFSIGGVSPLGFAPADGLPQPLLFLDRELFRFNLIWAAAGHPNGVFPMTPDELVSLTGAPVIDVVQA
ncbi:YbaK/EbsC family protein [Paucibacter sp. Y2R2-4]|uniref:YbaK/EbsC family protein n=1 Tax=Paucibacter sp. Y2R2-4 TaxID=2893553 RepID=UPI0021E3D979|nr:YbaK/EbsC family protein [Paucibacter sp. Y2R2-4]MCV2348852.1 YbaK/EbsC family protein [Paucibacter sp. Y2R2-4]